MKGEGIVEQLREKRPEFARRAVENDQTRSYPAHSMAELKAIGLQAMGIPPQLGGLGLSLRDQISITEEVAFSEGSLALALTMHRVSSEIISVWPDFAYGQMLLRETCSDGAMFCSVASIPTTGTDSRKAGIIATDQGDSYTLSGKAGFATNSEGAKYIVLMCSLADRPGLLLAPVKLNTPGVNLLLNWNGMGMRASSSHDITVENVVVAKDTTYFVAEHLLPAMRDDNPNKAGGQFAILGVWLGLAKAALDFTVRYVAERHGYMAGAGFNTQKGGMEGSRSEQPWAQIAIGKMQCSVSAVDRALRDLAVRYDAGELTREEDVRSERLELTYITREMIEEVMLAALKVGRAHAYVNGRPLERIVRDAYAGIVMKEKSDQLAQDIGRLVLGAPILKPALEPAV